MNKITCIRCDGLGQHVDKLAFDGGGVIECAICNGTGYLEPVTHSKPMSMEEKEQKILEAWHPLTSLEDQKRLLNELSL